MSSSIDTSRIRVESVLLALGILAFLQLSLMSDDDPIQWIRWARLATACGVLGLVLAAVILFDHRLRHAGASEAPRGPQIQPRDSYAKGLSTAPLKSDASVPGPRLCKCGAARFSDDYCVWCGCIFDKPAHDRRRIGGGGR